MAKKIEYNYTFTPASNRIVLDDIYIAERILLINNVTRGTTVYSFNDPTLKINSLSYDYPNETTTITLNYDCSAMSSSDKLQVFVEEDGVRFRPSETFVDPVSKIRVSQPENLIDTDFEYGLQSTKWETLELVKNIPTFFSRSGDASIGISSVNTTDGSDTVTVITSEDHNLQNGNPIIVSSTTNITCNGAFVVTLVIDTTSFQYRAKSLQNFTGNIADDTTQLFPGSVYQGTEFDLTGIDAITTDQAANSSLSVNTLFPTKFKSGASFYLTNSVGQINVFADATLVDPVTYTSNQITTTNNTATGEEGFTLGGVSLYTYTATEAVYFRNSEVTVNATINIESITFQTDHGFTDNTLHIYVVGEGNTVIGGLTNFAQYYVRVISTNAIYLTTASGSTARVNLTAAGTDGGVTRSAFLRAYRSTAISTATETITFQEAHGIENNSNTPVIFTATVGNTVPVTTITTQTSQTVYYTRTVGSATTLTVSATSGGANFNFTSATVGGAMIKVAPLSTSNTIYFPNHNLNSNDVVLFTVVTGTVPIGLVTNTYYKAEPISPDRIRFKNNETSAIITMTSIGSTTAQYRIDNRILNFNNDTFYVPNNTLTDGLVVTYNAQGGTVVGGLTDQTDYYVFQKSNDYFKLATTASGWKTAAINITQTTVNVSTNVITTASAHGFANGDPVQYLSATPIGGILNGAFYWVRAVSATTISLHWSKAGAIANNDTIDLTSPITGTGTVRAATMIDLTSAGSGTAKFSTNSVGSSDGVYSLLSNTNDTTFTLSANNQILNRTFTLVSQQNVNLNASAIYYGEHSLTTGTSITYTTTGSEIGGLGGDTVYYVIRINRDWFRLASTAAEADAGTYITLTSHGTGTNELTTSSISGEVKGSGTISVASGETKVTGVSTNFSSFYSPGDLFTIYKAETTANKTVSAINTTTNVFTSAAHGMADGSAVVMTATTAPSPTVNQYIYYTRSTGLGTPANEFTLHPTYDDAINGTNAIDVTTAGTTVVVKYISDIGSSEEATIRYVNSATELILRDGVSQSYTSVEYSSGTALYVRSDGFALHRPYDGGVELIPSSNPDSQIVRQTRKYFRYQSGKGIQVSFAINFSPTTSLDEYYVQQDTSKITKCERDIGYFIDGLGYDLTLGTNYNAIFLGIAETNSLDISAKVIQVIEDSRDEILALAAISGDAECTSLVNDYYTEVLTIVNNDRSSASELTFTNPTNASASSIAAKDKLLANLTFIEDEINAWVDVTYPDHNHDVSKCTRDVKYAVWGFCYDILYGGNSATYNGAKFFLYSYADGSSGITTEHQAQTVAAYVHLASIVSDVVQGIAITPSAGNSTVQVTSGANADPAEAATLVDLAGIIEDTINDGALPAGISKTNPSVTWADQNLQDCKTAIDSAKATIISTVVTSDIAYLTATATTRYPHRLTRGTSITISGASTPSGTNYWNGEFVVIDIPDPYTFNVSLAGVPTDLVAQGLVEFYVNNWTNSLLKCGLFDDQNGLFFEFNGQALNCVRRSSVQQISGKATVRFKSGEIIGVNTKFSSQLSEGDRVVIKGQTYLITKITNNNLMYILPSYRGTDNSNVIITKTVDTKVPQNSWSLDRCDGTGPSGFYLDIHRIQMAYMDYSWYGAGKVRFGFKNQDGHVIYVHEFIHNNRQTEAYMRSGNLPARYEIENTGIPSYVPALAHWGTSIIMDGRFDDDKAYKFTASSNNISITGSASFSITARVETRSIYQVFASGQYRNANYGLLITTPSAQYANIPQGISITGTGLQAGTLTALPSANQISPRQPYLPSVDSRYDSSNVAARTLLLLDRQPSATAGGTSSYTVTLASGATAVVYEQPLISVRLSPSVDTNTPGALGQREIINRMQLVLDSVGVLSTHSCEVTLKLNPTLNSNAWQRVTNPSLSQLIYHSTSDTVSGGTVVASFRAQGGTGTTGRSAVVTTSTLSDIATLGNSILGGDGIFPDGPDVLTLTVKLLEDPSTVSTTNPFSVTGRISWSESQA